MESRNKRKLVENDNPPFPAEVMQFDRGQIHQKGSASKKVLVTGCIVGLVLIIACMGLAIGIFSAAGITAAQNQDEWLVLADDFMQAMADKDTHKAYSLFADVSKSDFKPSDVSTFIDGPFYALFDGYVDLGIESWYINYGFPEGITAEIAGPVYYQDEYEGIYVFVVTEEDGNWKLLSFNVEVPPEKFNTDAAHQRSTTPTVYLKLPDSVLVNPQTARAYTGINTSNVSENC